MVPEDGQFLGELRDVGEWRVSLLWLVDGSIHLVTDEWKPLPKGSTEKTWNVVDSFEPTQPVPSRGWSKQLVIGYSRLRDQLYHGEVMPPFARIAASLPPRVNFVKFKEWLSVVDTQQGTRTPSSMFPNPFRQFVADHFAGEPAKDGSGRTSSAGPADAGHGSGGDPAAAQTAGTREGFVSELRTCHRRLLERIQDGEEYAQKFHEYPAIAAATWVVDTGASYDVVPTGAAEANNWQRVPLREPLAINTANGRI
jgi:hypothetical protein